MGYEAISIIKGLDRKLPIIITADENNPEQESRIRHKGIFYYHVNSFGLDELDFSHLERHGAIIPIIQRGARCHYREKLASGEFAILAEMEPPKGTDVSDMVAAATDVKRMVDAFVVPEMNNAVMRLSSLGGALLLQSKGLETVMQVLLPGPQPAGAARRPVGGPCPGGPQRHGGHRRRDHPRRPSPGQGG